MLGGYKFASSSMQFIGKLLETSCLPMSNLAHIHILTYKYGLRKQLRNCKVLHIERWRGSINPRLSYLPEDSTRMWETRSWLCLRTEPSRSIFSRPASNSSSSSSSLAVSRIFSFFKLGSISTEASLDRSSSLKINFQMRNSASLVPVTCKN